MRKREIEELFQKLNTSKYTIIKTIQDSNNNINMLNNISSSEEVDIGSSKSIVYIDENILIKNNKQLLEINKAIEKIKNNVYGKCEMCEKQIDIKRLRVKPHASFCITCREIFEKQNKLKS
ncbi:hypothetical protein CCY99_05740 [Helicobacter sp. 16-1353]|uniref:RNA polymerase-binding protein DksA n=1 Tax=Helicobacter sp. 16-1353 TaxID=2004996 RepID=UPI000DCBDE35|nr:RNA polymerase-binding protein DksA [Helicobacter sp. 16-1353]RAX53882.1 hypothetical protein CCY99_05740 [Helicobacter sp. 16-1353]